MNNCIKFSIITVNRNNIVGLLKTIVSLECQGYDVFEWIFVDGLSVDGSAYAAERSKIQNKVIVSESDDGIYDAMNKGIKIATGQYLLFLNSGDELASAVVLEDVVKAIGLGKSPDFIYGDSYEENSSGEFILKRAYAHRMVWYGMFAHHQAMFFSKSCMPSAYSTVMRYASDYGFVATHLRRSTTVLRVLFPICNFEAGGISQTGSILVANREQWAVRRTILGLSVIECRLIDWLHLLIFWVKVRLPVIYRFIRFRYGKS